VPKSRESSRVNPDQKTPTCFFLNGASHRKLGELPGKFAEPPNKRGRQNNHGFVGAGKKINALVINFNGSANKKIGLRGRSF